MRRASRDRGAAAVEMALTMPLLLLVVCAIIDFGRMFHTQITLTEAAREGARVAAFSPGTNNANVLARINLVTAGMTAVTATTTRCPAAGGGEAIVTAAHNFTFVTPFATVADLFGEGPAGTFPLTATGVMSC